MKKFIQLFLLVAFGSYLYGQNTVTFQVDMNDYAGSFTTVYVSGDFNSWSGNANALSDPNMDGVWEVSLPLTNDSIEFKYTLDNWAGQENLTAGSTCTKTSFGFTNRFLVITGNVTLPVSCYESCGVCSGVVLSIVDFPITWDDATVNYARTSFGGQSDSLKVDPTDPTNMVVKLDKGPGSATWSGTTLTTGGLANPIPFSSGGANTISVRFWSPDANTPVLLKVEDKNNGAVFVEAMDTTSVAGGWEYLEFDYNNPAPNALAINFANNYDLISLFPNFGTDGNTAGPKTYYVDDVIYGTVAVAGPLNGVYTINPSLAASTTNYTSFSAAAADLVALGVSGPVTFNIAPGSYTDTVYLPAIMGTSATNTILFDGGDSATTTLNHNSASGQYDVIFMDGADYVTFKGLTIKHSGTLDAWGIRLTNDNDYFTLDACRIEMLPTTSISELTCLGSSNTPTSQYGETEAGDNITITNSAFINGTFGVHIESTATFGDSNLVVSNNSFEGNYYRYFMSDNTFMTTLNGNTATGMTYSSGYGFAIYDVIGFEINNNYMITPDWGIYISDGNFNGDGVPPSTSNITNNMIISTADEALYLDDVEMVNIYYNSFVVTGTTSTSAYAAYLNDYYNMEVKNNVFYSEASYAVYFVDNTTAGTTTSGVITVDNNAYHTVSGANLAYDGAIYADLAAWQAGRVGNNVNSVSGDPVFVNPASDLHVAGALLNGVGTPIAGITTDIDGDLRDAVNPDLGADEYTPASCLPALNFTTLAAFADSARVAWTNPNGSGTYTIEYGAAGFTPGTGSLITAHPDTFVLITGLTATTDYEYYVTINCGASGVAIQSGPGSFRTACAIYSAPYLESFTGIALGHLADYANCWTNPSSLTPRWESEDATGGNENSTATGPFYDATTPAAAGGFYMYLETSSGSAGASSELVSPYIDHSSLTAPELSFYYHLYGATINKLLIYAEDGLGVRTLLDSVVGQQQTAGSDPFLRHAINLSGLPGTTYKYIFEGYRGTSFTGDLAIDDVAVDNAPSCSAPTALGVDSVNSSEAIVYWTTGGASNWLVEYGAPGFSLGSGTQIIATNDTITITGLNPNTAYEFYVADSCAPGDISAYSGPVSFNTTAFCPGNESLPYAENFDAGIGCFTAIDAGGASGDTWAHTVSAGQNLDGTGYMRVDSDANGNGTQLIETLQSPVIDASNVSTSLILEFDHYYRALNDSATVQVYDGTNWVNIAVYKASVGAWSNPTHEVFDVTAYANANFQVRFFYNDANNWAWYWSVDNFSVEDKCLTQSLPYVENFDANQGCFTTVDGGAASGDTWAHTAAGSQSLDGTGYMRVDSDANGNGTYMREVMTSPVIDASGYAGTLMLEYDHYYRSINSDTGWVDVWDGTTWVNLRTYTSSVGGWSAPAHEAIDISAYANANLQVRFDYDDGNTWAWYWSVDNFSVMDVGCLPPSALGAFNVTTNSADVFWTTGGASNWMVEYGPSGFTLGSGTRVAASNDTLSLSGLMGATSYDFYVADSCGLADLSTWTGPFTFSTACPSSVPAPYFTDFEGISLGNSSTFDNCWTTYGSTNPAWIADIGGTPSGLTGPSVDHTLGTSAGVYMFLETSSPSTLGDTNTLYSPAIDISTLTNAQVSFWYHMFGSTMGNIYVYAMDATGSRTLLDSIIGQQQAAQTDPWLQKLVDASGLASGTYRFLIEGEAGSSFYSDMAIDDFAVEEAPSCFASSALSLISAGNTSATVTWTAGTGTSWDVEYGPAGFMPGSGTVVNATNDTLTITGLMASTAYDFYVTDSCGSAGTSSTAGPGTFTTSACALADQCSYVFDLYDAFGDGWNGGALKVYQNGVQVATVGTSFSNGTSSLGNLVSLCDNQAIVVTLDPAGSWPSEIGVVVIQPNGDTAGVHIASSTVGTGDTLLSFTSNCSACATYAAPFFESFELSSPSIACWTIEAVSDTALVWSLGAGSTGGSISAAYAGSLNAVYISQGPSGAADTTRMVSPVINLSSLLSPQLNFWYAQENWFGDQNITNVYYRSSPNDPWTYLWGDNTDKASWTLASMSLPNPSSTYQIAIEGINNWGHANVVDSLSITDVAVVCTMPDSVMASNITATTADISWVSSSNTSSSWIEYGPAGFTPGTGMIVNPATSATSLTGLMPGTAYQACVYDICTALGDTSMAACVSFATLCAPISSYPYMEDFDNGALPTCWSETTTGTGYTWRPDAGGTPSTNTGPAVDHTTGTGAGFYMYVEASSPAAPGDSAFLFTPEFNMTSLTNPEIVYYYHLFGVDIVNLDLQVYDRTTMTWNSINNIVGPQQTSNGDAWGEARVSLAAYTADTALQFRFLSVRGASFDGDAAVDDIIIRETPACVDPTNLMVVTATSNSVVLSWNSDTNIVASMVQYGAPGFALGTGTTVMASPGGFTVSGLAGTTCYDFYVKDSCTTGTNWIGPVTACTIATCSVSSMPSGTTNDTTDCDGGSATLMATSSTGNDLVWTVNGVVRETGDTYVTDSVPFTTAFNVSEYVTTNPSLHVGPLTNIAAAGFGNFSNGQWITVHDTIHIDSMTVRHQNDVVAFAQLWDASISNVLQRGDTFSTPAGVTGDFRVPVNMVVTPGVYFMNVDFLSGAGALFRATDGAAYPYDLPGLMSIDSTNFAAQIRIYYTFDMTVSKACIGMPVQALAVVPGANAGTSDTSLVCATDMAVNMAAFLGVHDNGGTWVDNDATGANTDSILDATMLTAGNIYHFSYILAGVNGCAGDTANVYVDVEAAPFGGVDTNVAYCAGSGIKILRNLLTGTAFGGTWVDVDGSGALNTGTGVFNSNNASAGTYRINYILQGVVCAADTTTITVTVDDPVSAGVAVSDTVCDDENMVDLNSFLDASATAGGMWTDLSGTGALSGSIFNATAVANMSSYNFQYKVMSACGDDSVTVSLYVDDCDVSVRELSTGFINIYPNPTTGVIKIDDENVRGAITVEVFAGNGQLMISEEYAEGEEIRLDISEYAVGIYTVKVNSSKGLDVKRIMKQ